MAPALYKIGQALCRARMTVYADDGFVATNAVAWYLGLRTASETYSHDFLFLMLQILDGVLLRSFFSHSLLLGFYSSQVFLVPFIKEGHVLAGGRVAERRALILKEFRLSVKT